MAMRMNTINLFVKVFNMAQRWMKLEGFHHEFPVPLT